MQLYNNSKVLLVSLVVLAGVTLADDIDPPMVISENPMPDKLISGNPAAGEGDMPDKLISGDPSVTEDANQGDEGEKFLTDDEKDAEKSGLDAARNSLQASIAALCFSSVALAALI